MSAPAATGPQVVKVSLVDQVADIVRDRVARGELAPGETLHIERLARELGVSRTPVREAILRLREEQLVEVVPQLGTFVTPISLRAVRDAQFLRQCSPARI